MAHFAFLCIPTLGHFNPMAALARELNRRGHKTTVLHMPEVEPMARKWGLDFVPIGAETYGTGTLARLTRRASSVRGAIGVSSVVKEAAKETAMLCRELPQVLRSLRVDMILSDQLQAAGGLVAHHLGLPYISVANALPSNWEPGIPPPVFGWSYGETRWHRYRNIVGHHAMRTALRPLEDVIETISRDWRIGRMRSFADVTSRFAQISQLVPALDFPRRSLVNCFHYCGPLRDIDDVSDVPASPRRPTRSAFASLGSLQGHRVELFEQIAAATARSGLELTIAHGGRLSPRDVARLSRHATVHDFVAQRDALRTADLAILHGGLNTVLDALAQGVPVVLIPLAYEQGAIAARVLHSGAGRVCWRPIMRGQKLRSLVGEVLADTRYAEAAARVRVAIRQSGGVKRAADIVEQVLRTGQTAFNPTLS